MLLVSAYMALVKLRSTCMNKPVNAKRRVFSIAAAAPIQRTASVLTEPAVVEVGSATTTLSVVVLASAPSYSLQVLPSSLDGRTRVSAGGLCANPGTCPSVASQAISTEDHDNYDRDTHENNYHD